MKAGFMLLAAVLILICVAGCGSSDPAPAVGDAEITKDMPASQSTPAAAGARLQAKPTPANGLPLDK